MTMRSSAMFAFGALAGLAGASVLFGLQPPRVSVDPVRTLIQPVAGELFAAHRPDSRSGQELSFAWRATQDGQWSATDAFRPQLGSQAEPPALTPEFIERCLEVAAIIQPNLAEGLRTLRERDAAAFESRLRRSTRLLTLVDLKERDPRLFDLKLVELRVDAEVLRLARELRQLHSGREGTADIERVQVLERQLLGQVRLQVAFAIHARTDYLCRLQEEVARLERELAQDRERPDALVEQRLRALLGEAYRDGFGEPQR